MAFLLWHYLTEGAARHPERPAVEWCDVVMSYGDLEDRSARLAALLAGSGIGPGRVVGLLMAKSASAVVSMLGASRTGAAYVPVDPNAPACRAAFILANCEVRALITTGRKLSQLAEALREIGSLETIILADDGDFDADLPQNVRIRHWRELEGIEAAPVDRAVAIEDDPAYLLYTSGSTGTPKGVTISHRNAMAFVEWGAETFDVRPEDRLSNHAPLHFDLSVFDIYVALRSGACVVIVPDRIAPFPAQLAEWIESLEISIWYSVPSALTRLLLHGQLERFAYRKLRVILYAGEPFPVKYLRDVMARFRHARFYNLYGPTETNVCTYYALPEELGAEVRDVPIGKACPNTFAFAVRDDGGLAGPGEEGELYVRGPTVMLGYWRLPEKTASVLTINPFESAYQQQVYRTGDIVRLGGGGCYTFIGRRDHMVKSRGHRIELGEIEEAIYQHESVREAAVLAVPDEEIGCRINAVVTAHENGALTPRDLQRFCMDRLPKYMVPERIVVSRGALPRTSTGKIDRVSLLENLDEIIDEEGSTS